MRRAEQIGDFEQFNNDNNGSKLDDQAAAPDNTADEAGGAVVEAV